MSGDTLTPDLPSGQLAGYFGKMPARGDFVAGSLGREFVEPWDDWIQASIEQSRDRLGEQWLDIYLTSPLWCFALSPSICGEHAWGGVLMPSVDAVGRYFPLTIAAPLSRETNIVTLPTAAHDWYSRAEALARSSLDDEFDLGVFDQGIAGLGAPGGQAIATSEEQSHNNAARLGHAWRFGMPVAGQFGLDCPTLLHEAMTRLLFAYSLWWSSGSSRISPSYLFCQGLPPPQGYAAMLDGNWQRWGWDDRHVLHADLGVELPIADDQ